MGEKKQLDGYGLSTAVASGAMVSPPMDYLPPRPRVYQPKIALIGCGGISEYHLRAYHAMGLDVVALCDRNVARAEKRRKEFFPDAAVVGDFRDVLRRDEIEVVDIALHPAIRVEVIEAALRARKHVLSQKPFVLDLAGRLARRAARGEPERTLGSAFQLHGGGDSLRSYWRGGERGFYVAMGSYMDGRHSV